MTSTLTVQEVAERYGVCIRMVNRWLDSTWLPSHVDADGTRRVTEQVLQQLQKRINRTQEGVK